MKHLIPWSIAVFFLFTIIALAIILDIKNTQLAVFEEARLIGFHSPTSEEFRRDKDILKLWFDEHGLENYGLGPDWWVTDGKGDWKLNMRIKRPYVGQDFRGFTWRNSRAED